MADTTAVTDRWAEYFHGAAEGEDVSWAPVGEEDLQRLIEATPDDRLYNDLIWLEGKRLSEEQQKRSSFASELFPMGTYIALSQIESFVAWPDRIREIERHARAEEIGAATRARPGLLSDLWVWTVVNFTLSGRELLIELGEIGPNDRLDDVRVCVDFWRRLALGRRGDGTVDNTDAGLTNRYLPQEYVDKLIAETEPIDDEAQTAFQRFNATLSGYSFLLFTDSRCAICDSGPYPVDDDRVMIVRDYLRLSSGHGYPWADGISTPHENYTIAMIVDPSKLTQLEINDWGTTFSEPQLYEALTDIAVIGDSATDWKRIAPAQLGDLTTEFSTVHMELYKRFATMTLEERAISATKMYGWGIKPFTDFVGITDSMDWELAPGTMKFYPDPLGDTEAGLALYASIMPRASAYTRYE